MLEWLWNNRDIPQVALVVLLGLVAVWRGGAPERLIVCTFLAMIGTDRLYHAVNPEGWHWLQVDLGHFAIDAGAAMSILVIALKANRFYPLWLSALQFVALVSHVVRAINPTISMGAYLLLIVAPSFLQVLIFGGGLIAHLRRQRIYGPYKSWRHSSGHSPETDRIG